MNCQAQRQSDEMFCAKCNKRWDLDGDSVECHGAAQSVPLLIGLSGAAGSGKSTAAEYLTEEYGYRRLRFAAPLKDAMRRILRAACLDNHTIERMIEGDMKETPHPALMGKTPRHAMQTLGTEWGRNCLHGDFWVNLTQYAIQSMPAGTRIVIEDVRFDNEAAMVRSLGGKIIRMEGRGGIGGSHPSEQGVIPDMTCYNGGSLHETHRWFDYALTLTKR